MRFADADLDAMLQAASGASAPNVVFGAQSCFGILRTSDQLDTSQGTLQLSDASTTVLIRDGALIDLVEDATIAVDGNTYLIRHTGTRLTDGARRITLAGPMGA